MPFFSVKRLRERMGLDTEEFARLFPVHERTVRRWEADEVLPSPMAVMRMRKMEQEYGGKETSDAVEKAPREARRAEPQGETRPARRRVNGDASTPAASDGAASSGRSFSFLQVTPPRTSFD